MSGKAKDFEPFQYKTLFDEAAGASPVEVQAVLRCFEKDMQAPSPAAKVPDPKMPGK